MKPDAARRKVLITGVRSGIGNAIARAALDAGYEVWGTGRELAKLPAGSAEFHPVALDLLDPESIEQAVDQIQREAGELHAVVHNAGSGAFGPVDEMEPALVLEQFDILCHGPWRLTQLLLPYLHLKSGRVIFITSLAARLPIPGMGPYNAAKAALSSLIETARLEPARENVTWVEVQPGDIATSFNDNIAAIAPRDAVRRQAFHDLWEKVDHHMRAAPSPECVARAVVRLLRVEKPPRRVNTGDFFQTRLAPLAWRLFPKAWMERLVRAYYGIR